MVKLPIFFLIIVGCAAAANTPQIRREDRPTHHKEAQVTAGIASGGVVTKVSLGAAKKTAPTKNPPQVIYIKDQTGQWHEEPVGGTSSLTQHQGKAPETVKEKADQWKKEEQQALQKEQEWETKEETRAREVAKQHGVPTLPDESTTLAPPASFLQSEPATGASLANTGGAKDAKKARDEALAEAQTKKVLYTLEKKSKKQMSLEAANARRIENLRQWREAANPVEPYDGPTDPMSFTEMSKRRTEKAKSYDGMRAVGSGFWADDRPNERRVDILDHKVYTWKQYRLKHGGTHSWTVEEMWKKLPTEKRVKKLGKAAFVARFR